MRFYCWERIFLYGRVFNILIKLVLIDVYCCFYFCLKQNHTIRRKCNFVTKKELFSFEGRSKVLISCLVSVQQWYNVF